MYRTISAAFWTDPKVKTLPVEAKLVFIYLITSPHSHVSGIYHLSLPYASADLKMTAGALVKTLNTLSGLGFCRLDAENSIIWVRRMFDYQGRGEKNARSAARHLVEDLHNSILCAEFLTAYPHVKQYISEVELDRISHRVFDTPSESGTPDSPFPIPDSQFPNPNQEQNQNSARVAHGKTPAPAEMEVTTADWNWASKERLVGVDLEAETRAMIDWAHGKGEKRADWIATRRNWWRNAYKRNGTGNGNGKPGAIAAFPRPELTPEEAAKLDEEIKALRATMS